jgi:hypothetical protein
MVRIAELRIRHGPFCLTAGGEMFVGFLADVCEPRLFMSLFLIPAPQLHDGHAACPQS